MSKSKQRPTKGSGAQDDDREPRKSETEHVETMPANPQKTETAPNAKRRDKAEDRRRPKTNPKAG